MAEKLSFVVSDPVGLHARPATILLVNLQVILS